MSQNLGITATNERTFVLEVVVLATDPASFLCPFARACRRMFSFAAILCSGAALSLSTYPLLFRHPLAAEALEQCFNLFSRVGGSWVDGWKTHRRGFGGLLTSSFLHRRSSGHIRPAPPTMFWIFLVITADLFLALVPPRRTAVELHSC